MTENVGAQRAQLIIAALLGRAAGPVRALLTNSGRLLVLRGPSPVSLGSGHVQVVRKGIFGYTGSHKVRARLEVGQMTAILAKSSRRTAQRA